MSTAGHSQLNVLVVDDDPDMRELLVNITTGEGHQAVPARSAEEILKLLPYWTFQVAFIDQRLPGMEGLILGEYMARSNSELTVVLVTGSQDDHISEKCVELGFSLVTKPFKVGQITDLLHSAAARDGSRPAEEGSISDHFAPPVSGFADELTERFDMPSAPSRIEAKLLEAVKRSLNSLRSEHRFNEEDRVIAFSGLITARVLGIRLPKASSGRTLYQEYDSLMEAHGLRTEFEN